MSRAKAAEAYARAEAALTPAEAEAAYREAAALGHAGAAARAWDLVRERMLEARMRAAERTLRAKARRRRAVMRDLCAR